MEVSVIGGTGLVGHALIERLENEARITRVFALVRRRPQLATSKTEWLEVDFEQRESWAPLLRGDAFFSTMGTTLKAAGSKEAQRRVDFDYQYWASQAALENGVRKIALVSSQGADAQARFFYPRLKGELEAAVLALGFEQTVILRPSFLDGKRNEKRAAEGAALQLLRHLPRWQALNAIRPVAVEKVAAAGLSALIQAGSSGVQIIESSEIQKVEL